LIKIIQLIIVNLVAFKIICGVFMKRNRLYIVISIITILCLFITAATCSFCAKQTGVESSSVETKIDVNKETIETESKETEKDTASTETTKTIASADTTQTDNKNSDKKAPTISLAVTEGPTYSSADDVCYYRIKASVTGSPAPKITWSADYSNGSFGNTMAQVNLTRNNPNYTLTATATNSEGSATSSIALSWGCGGSNNSTEKEDEEKEEKEITKEEETFHLVELNRCPTVSIELLFHGNTLYCGAEGNILCTAQDADEDILSRSYSMTEGVIIEGITIDTNSERIKIKAPDHPTTMVFTVRVSDGTCEVYDTKTINVVSQ
jgi:hypothetical protein